MSGAGPQPSETAEWLKASSELLPEAWSNKNGFDVMRTVASRFEARPVGQGAFIRGQVEFFVAASDSSGSIAPLRWIYDCGTESREDSIDASVDDLGVSWPKGSRTKGDGGN